MKRDDLNSQLRPIVFGDWPDEEERSFYELRDKVMAELPIPAINLVKIAFGQILSDYLQDMRREKIVRSVRKGHWKREEAATRDEVAGNQNRRLRTAKSTIGNVVVEMVDKASEMPGLKQDVAANYQDLVDLVADELGLDLDE